LMCCLAKPFENAVARKKYYPFLLHWILQIPNPFWNRSVTFKITGDFII